MLLFLKFTYSIDVSRETSPVSLDTSSFIYFKAIRISHCQDLRAASRENADVSCETSASLSALSSPRHNPSMLYDVVVVDAGNALVERNERTSLRVAHLTASRAFRRVCESRIYLRVAHLNDDRHGPRS